MAVFGCAGGPRADPQYLQRAGATVFFDMAELPRLLQPNQAMRHYALERPDR